MILMIILIHIKVNVLRHKIVNLLLVLQRQNNDNNRNHFYN